MASAFGDQAYSKLPPIRKGEEGDESDMTPLLQSFNREAHGLVRLPPIHCEAGHVPLDVREDTEQHSGDDRARGISPPLSTSNGQASDRFYAARRKPDTFRRSAELDTPHDGLAHIWDEPEAASDLTSLLRRDSDEYVQHDGELFAATNLSSSLDARRAPRREHLLNPEPRLHRSRRLAKSSPNLSGQRKVYKAPAKLTKSVAEHERTATIPLSLTRGSGRNERETFDIDVNVFPLDQGALSRAKGSKEMRGIKGNRTAPKHDERQSSSHPNTPVVPHYFEHNVDRMSRKSLGDIGDYALPLKGRRHSLAPPKQQNLMSRETGMGLLRVDGKMCPQNERRNSRSATPRLPSETLQVPGEPPAKHGKRPSVYDLHQILSVLNKEAGSTKQNALPRGELLASATRNDRAGSVYDLKEFLLTQQQQNPASLLPTDTAKDSSESRRGSFYDLVEFLSLNASNSQEKPQNNNESVIQNKADTHLTLNTASNGQKNAKTETARQNTADALLMPNGRSGSQDDESRRSSVYDLMEFLTLARQNEVTQKDVKPQTQPRDADAAKLQTTTRPLIALETPAEDRGDITNTPPQHRRNNSIYDLAEFLNMTRNPPPSGGNDLKPTSPNATLLTPTSPKLPNLQFKRESIYDLHEFLGVLQKEAEMKRSNGNHGGDDIGKDSATNSQRTDTKTPRSSIEHNAPVFTFETPTLRVEPSPNRAMSLYDLREFLSLYATQPAQPEGSPRLPFNRKASTISQSSIMVNVVEDEHGNGNVEEVFLALPMAENLNRKRSSVYDLNEFLGMLNSNDSPLRRRLSSVSSTSETTSSGRPSPVSRHDSGGAKSLYDLGEFLNMMNEESVGKKTENTTDEIPPPLSRHDSGGGRSLYNLEEFLPILNECATLSSKEEDLEGNEIRIPVPQLPARQPIPERMTLRKRVSAPKPALLNSVPETSEVASKQTEGRRTSVGHCL